MNKKTLTILLLIGIVNLSIAQVTDLGGPVSFNEKKDLNDKNVPTEVMPSFDLENQLIEDELNSKYKVGPYRFGFEHSVNFGLNNSGIWEVLSNGDKVWRLNLKCEGALSVNLIFHDFFIPEGASLYIYNEDRTMYDGGYSSINNNVNNMLGTQLVKGESVIVEYYEPSEAQNEGRLILGTVVHGYKDINNWYPQKVNESGACNMDVICSDGDPWRDEIRSEARILNGGGLCTGTLVNNTAQDETPYFLTANHCGPASMGSAVFRFNYDSPICGSQSTANSTTPSSNNTINGCSHRASKADSDFGLVELNSIPPASYNVYYAGWDNSSTAPQSAVGIHHPSGDVKKISFDDDPLTSAQGLSSVSNSEWRIEAWERNTTTEGGSSGSGLWNQNHHIVGQLHGGTANCSNSVDDYYGKFDMSWDGNGSGSSAERLHDWLDPQNTGVTTLDGFDPNAASLALNAGVLSVESPVDTYCSGDVPASIVLKNHGTSTLTSITINYDIDGGSQMTYPWTGNLATGETEVVTLQNVTISVGGDHTFNVALVSPNGSTDESTVNDQGVSSFTAYPGSVQAFMNFTFDCWGSETSWSISDQTTSSVIWSKPAGSYADGNGGVTVNESICLQEGCYTLTVEDTEGDGVFGSQFGSCSDDGDYSVTDYYGGVYTEMTAANGDFGSSATHDFCVANLGVNEKLLESTMSIYPNPASHEVFVKIDQDLNDSFNIEVLDAQARVIKTINPTNNITKIEMSDVAKGVYFIRLTSSFGAKTDKLIIR